MPTSTKDKIVVWGCKACIYPFIGLFYCVKYTIDGTSKIIENGYELRERVRVKRRRLPKSKPLAGATLPSRSGAPETKTTTTRAKTSFLHLPTEIRLQIYRIALGDPAIAQVRTYHALWAPRLENWGPRQGIRDDADEPSGALRLMIGLGGSGLRQTVVPPCHGCVRYPCLEPLICGKDHLVPTWLRPQNELSYTDLMRACRVIYDEVLDVLYAGNTISLFGSEMAQYFCRNASPEGLRRIRWVHVALTIPSSGWDSRSQRKSIQGTIRMLQGSFLSLQQLDIEVVLLWGQPKDPQRFWIWLRNDVLAQLHGLERFVLKVSVYKPLDPSFRGGYDTYLPEYESLEAWNDGEYRDLKAKITLLEETILP
ncbi:hypothetical protein Hte_009389 [Hypoxylon texense]